jgi:murein DD-endopeptidase MepM/ murein hydrolase activator NlpD
MREDITEEKTPGISADQWGPGYRLWQAVRGLLVQRGPEGTTTLVRMASHLVILLVAVAVLWISRLQLPAWEIAQAQAEQPSVQQTEELPLPPGAEAAGVTTLARAAVPLTLIPDRPRIEIITHTVQAGDTLYDIAAKYHINAETVMWANSMELNPDLLRLGQELTILPVNGVYHAVVAGDTLEGIAKKYKALVANVVALEWNGLNPKNPQIVVGQKLIVPGGSKPQVVRQVQVYTGPVPAGASRGAGRFVWPASGSITTGFKPLHPAIDIGSWLGAAVKASDSGYVAVAGWSNVGYGYYVVLDHGNGFQTLYAHLSRYFVNAGDSVAQGATIGLVGSTGNSTGPHLHFELIQGGVHRNPFGFLP